MCTPSACAACPLCGTTSETTGPRKRCASSEKQQRVLIRILMQSYTVPVSPAGSCRTHQPLAACARHVLYTCPTDWHAALPPNYRPKAAMAQVMMKTLGMVTQKTAPTMAGPAAGRRLAPSVRALAAPQTATQRQQGPAAWAGAQGEASTQTQVQQAWSGLAGMRDWTCCRPTSRSTGKQRRMR